MVVVSFRKGSFCGFVLKLSFIYDSFIVRVNIGNSNGNGFYYLNYIENYFGVRRICKF